MLNRFLQMRYMRLGLALAFGGASLCQALPVLAQAQSPWIDTATRAHPTGKAVFREFLPENESLDIAVVLKLRNRGQLDQRVRAITTRGNPGFCS